MSSLLERLIRSVIKRGIVTVSNIDSKQYPRTQIRTISGERRAEELYHYGAFGVAPTGSMCVSFNIGASEANQIAITYSPSLRPQALKPGEYVCGNFLRSGIVKFNDDGSIKMTTKKGAIIEETAEGDVKIYGVANVSIEGGSANVSVKAGGDVSVEAGANAMVKAAQAATVQAGTTATIKANTSAVVDSPVVSLGTGGAPIARLGDTVQVDPFTHKGTITSASATNTSA